MKRKNY